MTNINIFLSYGSSRVSIIKETNRGIDRKAVHQTECITLGSTSAASEEEGRQFPAMREL